MNLANLTYFTRVARLQHLSQAAKELGITQPALSRAIARLEDEIGVSLFVRHGRSLRLNLYGKAFLSHAQRAIDEVDAGAREVNELAGHAERHIALGFVRSLGVHWVPDVVRRYCGEVPDVHFTFSPAGGVALEKQILGGEISLALMVGPPRSEALVWSPILSQRMLVTLPPGHRLKGRKSLAIKELQHETFLSFKPGHGVREFTDRLCAAAGFEPRIGFEGEEAQSIRAFVDAGFGIAIVPETGTVGDRDASPLSDTDATRQAGIVWAKDGYRSAAEREFQAFVLEHRPPLRPKGLRP